MASHFGEIIFPSSRAFWDGDDYEISEGEATNKVKFTIEWIGEIPTVIEKMIFVEGAVLIDFAKNSLIPDLEKVCTIKSNALVEEHTTIYKNDDFFICVIGVEVDPPTSAKFVESIGEILKLTKLMIGVTSDHVTHFKSHNRPESPSFLRVLYTDCARSKCIPDIPFLSQPNFVSGAVAGVVAYSEAINVPAILYILYIDTFVLDARSATPLTKLFSSIFGHALPEYMPSCGKGFFTKENLYI